MHIFKEYPKAWGQFPLIDPTYPPPCPPPQNPYPNEPFFYAKCTATFETAMPNPKKLTAWDALPLGIRMGTIE